ncbi:AAA family ATPase [Bradyrhizobium sp. Arg62]|uniref:AAA family ATPase n=1 Tax=Bradyrhizobium brasilense TaxID=1419277 RepID=UPI001E56394F|nr:AAA family ATPase [Bradyrhizobium brasilense]MCC8950216.1 AAA family ATPase [Bradyrhizobium brasilense]
MRPDWQPGPLSVLPAEANLLVAYLARERAFRGIGPRRAAALGEAFGAGLKDAIMRLDEGVIELVGEEPALAAAAAIEVRQAEAAMLEWIDAIGARIPIDKAIRIARAWGPQGVEAVRQNPYLLLSVSDWKTVDGIARTLGISEADPRRDVAALEAVLTGEPCLGQGSTRMAAREAQRAAERHLGRPAAPTVQDLAVASSAAIRLADALQPPGAAHMEAECALTLARLASQAPVWGAVPREDLDRLLQAYEGKQCFRLTDAQREAVRMAHRHRLMVLAGYAGSGKTTVLRGVCETLENVGRSPLIVTLSGRAAQRAAEATGRLAITVARFLLDQEKAEHPLSADRVLIADEASMLGLVEFWRILRRLGSASLLLCGDPAQLPPVNPGVVFHHLAGDPEVPRVVLDRVHRQDERTGIPALAEGIRQGRTVDLPEFTEAAPGVTFTACLRESLAGDVMRIGKALRAFGTDRDEVQIVAPTNKEIGAINGYFHGLLRQRRAALWPSTGHIAEGEPVIWTQNNPERGLTNGSMGRISRIAGERIDAVFDGEKHELTSADGQFLQLAYAVSVHKAQGSQWKRVIVPIFPSRILDRSLVYTALTRAQEQVIFLGDPKALRQAVKRLPAAERRDCGFGDWLRLARDQKM